MTTTSSRPPAPATRRGPAPAAALLTVLGLSALLPAAGPDAETARELRPLQGTWHLLVVEEEGERFLVGKSRGWTLTIKGDRFVFRARGEPVHGTYRPVAGPGPKRLDALRTSGEDKGKTLLGIYALDGDELKMCFSRPGDARRPEGFTTSGEGAGHRLYVLRRGKS